MNWAFQDLDVVNLNSHVIVYTLAAYLKRIHGKRELWLGCLSYTHGFSGVCNHCPTVYPKQNKDVLFLSKFVISFYLISKKIKTT